MMTVIEFLLAAGSLGIVAGTDNGVPVHSLFLELELYVKDCLTPFVSNTVSYYCSCTSDEKRRNGNN